MYVYFKFSVAVSILVAERHRAGLALSDILNIIFRSTFRFKIQFKFNGEHSTGLLLYINFEYI